MSEERVTTPVQKTITLADGKEYVVKSLTLKDAKNILPIIEKFDNLRKTMKISEELIDTMVEIAYEILKRHNQLVTKEQLYEILELDSTYKLITMCVGA